MVSNLMIAFIQDNFISKKECRSLIKFYNLNKNKAVSFRDVFPLNVVNFGDIKNRLDEKSKELNGSKVDWMQIVRWPVGSKQNLHFDNAKEGTKLASIVYLNDEFEGGETYFKEGITISPKKGRVLFFDGNYFKHGVNKVNKLERFVIAAWYNSINDYSIICE